MGRGQETCLFLGRVCCTVRTWCARQDVVENSDDTKRIVQSCEQSAWSWVASGRHPITRPNLETTCVQSDVFMKKRVE